MSGTPRKPKTSRRSPISALSHEHAIANADRRTRPGRILRDVQRDLVDHLGGNPSPAQMLIIRSAAIKAVRIEALAEKLIAGDDISAHANDHVLAWCNSLRHDMVALGLERRVKDVTPSLDAILAKHATGAP